MSARAAPDPVRLALDIADPALADQLAALLAGVAGLRLVGPGEAADVAVVVPVAAAASTEPDNALTPRELEVLALLAEGASNKVIARRLGISVHTAKFHVGSLIDKLDAISRTDVVAHAARRGVILLWQWQWSERFRWPRSSFAAFVVGALIGLAVVLWGRAMIADIDIHRCAWLMIRRYGDDAVVQAAMRGDDLLAKGDLDGMLVWQAIISAIRRLRRKLRPGMKPCIDPRRWHLARCAADREAVRLRWLQPRPPRGRTSCWPGATLFREES